MASRQASCTVAVAASSAVGANGGAVVGERAAICGEVRRPPRQRLVVRHDHRIDEVGQHGLGAELLRLFPFFLLLAGIGGGWRRRTRRLQISRAVHAARQSHANSDAQQACHASAPHGPGSRDQAGDYQFITTS